MKGKTKDLTDEELHQFVEKAKTNDIERLESFVNIFIQKSIGLFTIV